MKDEPRTRFKSWKCPYYGPLALVPPPSKDEIIYVVTDAEGARFRRARELVNQGNDFARRYDMRRPASDFDWMK